MILALILSCNYAFSQAIEYFCSNKYLFDCPVYKYFNPSGIKSLKVLRYTEAGLNERIVKDKNEIYKIYDLLKHIKLLNETKYSCTDNTTVYVFMMADGAAFPVEIECDWIVIQGKNYNFEVVPEKKK